MFGRHGNVGEGGKKEKRKLHEEPNSEQICHSDCQKRRWDVEAPDGLKKNTRQSQGHLGDEA